MDSNFPTSNLTRLPVLKPVFIVVIMSLSSLSGHSSLLELSSESESRGSSKPGSALLEMGCFETSASGEVLLRFRMVASWEAPRSELFSSSEFELTLSQSKNWNLSTSVSSSSMLVTGLTSELLFGSS